MNSEQLISILKQDPYTASIFRGVYPINRLPPIRNGIYVINTAPDTHPGLHWVALFVTDNSIEYFDSYGGDPPTALHRWGKRKQWITNPIPLQNPLTSVCGQYCLYYLLYRTRRIAMIDLLMDFHADVDRNDKLVYDFVEERYDLEHLTLVDTENVISQLYLIQVSERWPGQYSSAPHRMAKAYQSSEVQILRHSQCPLALIWCDGHGRQHVIPVWSLWMCVPVGDVFSQPYDDCAWHFHKKIKKNIFRGKEYCIFR